MKNYSLQDYINRVAQINPREAEYIETNAAHLFQDWGGAAGGNWEHEIISFIIYQLNKIKRVDPTILYGYTSQKYQNQDGIINDPILELKASKEAIELLDTMIEGFEGYFTLGSDTTITEEAFRLLCKNFMRLWN